MSTSKKKHLQNSAILAAEYSLAGEAPLQCLRDGPIAVVIINRPARRNAMPAAAWRDLPSLMAKLSVDTSVGVVVLRGAGDVAFSAGADISEFADVYRSAINARRYNELVKLGQASVEQLNKPTLAMIHGACIGGGCGLALSCDLRFAADDVRMGITPSKLGAAYSLPDTRRLVAATGPSTAKDLLFSGRLIGASDAMQAGLLDRVTAKGCLGLCVSNYVSLLLENSRQSIAVSKTMVNSISGVDPQTEEELDRRYNASFSSADFREGTQAFLEKRLPKFGA